MKEQCCNGIEAIEAVVTQEVNVISKKPSNRPLVTCTIDVHVVLNYLLNEDYVEAKQAHKIFCIFSVFCRDLVLELLDYTIYVVLHI